MTQAGRNILLRIEIWCARGWAEALGEADLIAAEHHIRRQSRNGTAWSGKWEAADAADMALWHAKLFDANAWAAALRTIRQLILGVPALTGGRIPEKSYVREFACPRCARPVAAVLGQLRVLECVSCGASFYSERRFMK